MTAIDTNILVYACDSADEFKQSRALEVIGKMEDGVLLWQVACEFIAASRKLSKQGFTAIQAWARLSEFRDLLPLVRPSADVLVRGRELHLEHGMSFWDALIVAACLDCGAEVLISEDIPSASRFASLEIVNPFSSSLI
jgi:predicted nucleic acid-binding protein